VSIDPSQHPGQYSKLFSSTDNTATPLSLRLRRLRSARQEGEEGGSPKSKGHSTHRMQSKRLSLLQLCLLGRNECIGMY